jgi:phage tail sheath gpL-like
METKTEQYRGYQIVVTPIKDHEDLWDFQYQVTKVGDPNTTSAGHSITRRETLGGYATAGIACDAGIEVAKIEVDNYIAIKEK